MSANNGSINAQARELLKISLNDGWAATALVVDSKLRISSVP
ncbi:hypothetical protein [Granulosicoccus antarcticus]|nr:hypothetical protein [Granulosicoccus antarcticus]